MKKRYGTWKILWIISLASLMVLYSAAILQAGLLEDLVRMFPGREACKAAANPVTHTAADCDRAFDQLEDAASQADSTIESGIDSAREAGEEGLENLQDMGEQALDCASDPIACGQRIYDELVNAVGQAADEARENMALAKLQGTIRDESGNPLRLIPVTLSVDESNADTDCKTAVAIWRSLNAGLLGSGTLSSPIDGTYSFMVPSCGEIIYTISPVNPLLTWSPPSRKVTVTPDDGTGGQAFQVEHIGVDEGLESAGGLFIIQQEAESTTGGPGMGIETTEPRRQDTVTESSTRDATSGIKSETKTDEPTKESTDDTKSDTTTPSKTQETEKSDSESEKKGESSSVNPLFRSGY